MIEVSEALKTAYKRDSVHKNLVIRFLDGSLPDITNGNIIAESMVLDEILCDEEQIKFGLCNASTFSIQVANINVNIKGKNIAPVLIIDGEELPLGIFTIQKVEKMQGKAYKTIYAIDYMDIVNSDVTEWYNALEFPMTIKALRDALFEHLGLQQMEITLPIDILSVVKMEKDIILGTDIIQPICELCGSFGHFDRYGKFAYIRLNNNSLYPSDNLYPSNELFPHGDTDTAHLVDDEYNLLKSYPIYEDYTTCDIESVMIIDEEGVIYSNSSAEFENTYRVENNYIISNQNTETMSQLIDILHEAISGMYYTPVSVLEIKGQPYIELGDEYVFSNNQDVVTSFILTRHLTGIQSLTDSITAPGMEYLTYDDNGIFKKLNNVNNKADAISKDLENTKVTFAKTIDGFMTEVSKEITETKEYAENAASEALESANNATDEKLVGYTEKTTFESYIEQTAENISTKVSKNEIISEINQSAEEVSISANKINLNGAVTANQNFKILEDGSIETLKALINGTVIADAADEFEKRIIRYMKILKKKYHSGANLYEEGITLAISEEPDRRYVFVEEFQDENNVSHTIYVSGVGDLLPYDIIEFYDAYGEILNIIPINSAGETQIYIPYYSNYQITIGDNDKAVKLSRIIARDAMPYETEGNTYFDEEIAFFINYNGNLSAGKVISQSFIATHKSTVASTKGAVYGEYGIYPDQSESDSNYFIKGFAQNSDTLYFGKNINSAYDITCKSLTQTSDEDKKKDIKTLDIQASSDFIYSLHPVKFRFKENQSNRYHHGLLANEVKDAMGNDDWGLYVDGYHDTGESGGKGLRYDELIADLIATVQLQNKRIEELERKIKIIES